MKSLRYLWLLLLTLAAMPAAGQRPGFRASDLAILQPVETGAAFYYPTNIPTQGAAAYAWYVAQDYTTNSGMGTLPDRISGMNATNTAGANTPNEGPSLNGNRTLYFDGTTEYFISQPFDGGAQPYSIHAVLALTNNASTASGLFSTTNNGGNTYAAYIGSSGRAQVRVTSQQNPGYFDTNKWMSVVFIYNGATSQVWTNGVQLGADFNPGAGSWLGLEINRLGLSTTFDGRWTLAEATFYTNTALTSANVSNLFSYSTNVYGFGY